MPIGTLVNPIVYAAVSIRFSRVEVLEDALPASEFRRAPLPWAAAFIGAHAAIEGLALLTRDVRRYRTYFPSVELIARDV